MSFSLSPSSLSAFAGLVCLGLVPIFACLSHSLGHSICCRSEKGNQSSSSLISMSISAAVAVPGNVDCHVSGAITSLCLRRKKERKNEPETASSAAVWPYQLIDCPFSLSSLHSPALVINFCTHSQSGHFLAGSRSSGGSQKSVAKNKALHKKDCTVTRLKRWKREKVVRVSHCRPLSN